MADDSAAGLFLGGRLMYNLDTRTKSSLSVA